MQDCKSVVSLTQSNNQKTNKMNTQNYLQDNREQIIKSIKMELNRKVSVCGRAATDLKGAMIVYKKVLEATEKPHLAKKAAEDAINGSIKASSRIFMSENAKNVFQSL